MNVLELHSMRTLAQTHYDITLAAPIDIMTARLGLRYLWEAFQPHHRRLAYDEHIAIGTSLDLLPAIIMTEDGRCALLHPTRAQPPPPPPRLGRITTFFESGTAPRPPPRPDSPTIVERAPPPSPPPYPTPATPTTVSNTVPRVEDLTPCDTSNEWCTRSLKVK
jgi:hypothetical protein